MNANNNNNNNNNRRAGQSSSGGTNNNNNNNNRNGGGEGEGRGDHGRSDRSSHSRTRQQQARSTSFINARRALEKFREQSRVWDRGKEKFKERLQPTTSELIDYVNHDWQHKSLRRQASKLRATAMDIERRERAARNSVRAVARRSATVLMASYQKRSLIM